MHYKQLKKMTFGREAWIKNAEQISVRRFLIFYKFVFKPSFRIICIQTLTCQSLSLNLVIISNKKKKIIINIFARQNTILF